MSKNHYPGANRTAQYYAGKFVGSTMNTNCACIHTTEGFTWPSYGGGASAPHATIMPDIKARTISMRQHFPANKSSRALVNLAGGVETNTLGVFQIELIGTCDSRYRERWGNKVAGVDYIYWPDAPDWLLEAIAPVFQWLDAEWPDFKIVDAAPRGWVRYPESYGLRARQRMTAQEFVKAFGIFGHQHVPENTHGDPGNFPIDRLILAATGKPGTAPRPAPPTPTAPKPQAAVWDLPSTWEIGSTGAAVTKLGQRLVIWAKHLGLPAPYKVGPGPEFTETDRAAVGAFQRAQGWTGADADGFPGPETFRRLATTPTTPAKPLPVKPGEGGPVVEYISVNLAGYNDPVGIATAVHRAKNDIPDYLRPKRPLWFHFQECSKPMLEHIDAAFPEYERVPEGGKGRESYHLRDAGIKILGAELLNVTHMLGKDTKEHLVIPWEIDGHRAVDVNFHNENEGSTFQVLQLRDVMTNARKAADKHDAPRANIAVTGDANLKTAAAFAWSQCWAEASHIAKKKIDLGYSTLNRWSARLTKGARIDVDIFQRDADVLETEVLFGSVIADHWAHRVVRRLKKK